MKVTTAVGERAATLSAGQAGLDKSAHIAAGAAAVVAPDVMVGEQAERLQAAQNQLARMPAIDAQRVAEIKQALERGEIGFDPKKIAGLIVKHHGGRS